MEAFLVFLSAFIISATSIPSIIKVAKLKQLFDDPCKGEARRKVHKESIPSLGGVAIFAGFILSSCFFLNFADIKSLQYVLFAVILMFFTGIKDDILILVARKKLVAQIVTVATLIYFGDFRLTSLYGILGIYDLPYSASFLLSCITIIGIINSVNFIDGVDTLAGMLTAISSAVLGFWFFNYGHDQYAFMSFALLGATLGFLIFNWTPAKIFMGDTGALILGTITAVLLIRFIEINKVHSYIQVAPTFAIALILIPLFDTIQVICVRLYQRRSPFEGDRNHIHHLLVDMGFSHVQCSLLLSFLTIINIVFVYLFQDIGKFISLESRSSEILAGIMMIELSAITIFIKNKIRRSREKNRKIPSTSFPLENQQDLQNNVQLLRPEESKKKNIKLH